MAHASPGNEPKISTLAIAVPKGVGASSPQATAEDHELPPAFNT
jgi:hypothetical protein